MTLKIFNSHHASGDLASDRLIAIANSLLFTIDVRSGVTLTVRSLPLTRQEELEKRRTKSIGTVRFSGRVPEPEPLSLYWQARTLGRFPLAQYLSYYQVLEHYFPLYKTAASRGIARSILSDHDFDLFDDTQMMRLVNAITHRSNNSNEQEQLLILLNESIPSNEVIEYIKSSKSLFSFFEERRGTPSQARLSSVFLDLGDPKRFHDTLSSRIYSIRCRIVHTKSDAGFDKPLFPCSPEITLLKHDLSLIQYLARRLLAVHSTKQ